MRARGRIIQAAVVCCGMVLAASACGTDRMPYRKARITSEAAQLRALLRDMADLPPGFSERARGGWHPPFQPGVAACRTLFDVASGRPPREGLSGTAAATFQGERVGELAAVGLSAYTGNGPASSLAQIRAAMDDCETASIETAGGADRLTVSDLSLPDVGADVTARRLTGRVGGYPYEMHLVVAEAGGALVTLLHAGLGPADDERTAELIRLLMRKVGTLDL